MITRCSLLITILISFLPSHEGCFTTVAEEDFTAPATTAAVTTTFAETTTVETTTTLTPTTSTTSTTTTTTTTTTTLPPCPALFPNLAVSQTPAPFVPTAAFSPVFYPNTYPVGTTLTIQCILTPAGTGAGNMGTSVQVRDDSGATYFQDVNNLPSGGESFTVTCLPSGLYELVISTTLNPTQSATVTVGGTGFLHCLACSVPSATCLSPTG